MQYLVIDMFSSVDMTGACAASSRLMWSLFLPFNVIFHRANGPANVINIWFMEQGQNCCMLNKNPGLKYRFVSSLLRLSFKIGQQNLQIIIFNGFYSVTGKQDRCKNIKVMRMELQYF